LRVSFQMMKPTTPSAAMPPATPSPMMVLCDIGGEGGVLVDEDDAAAAVAEPEPVGCPL
jgi:hypothetical protein